MHHDSSTPQDVGFQLAINVGELLRDVGMARTLEAEPESWLESALQALRRFVKIPGWHQFKMEDFRAWYADSGLPAPHSSNVWGAFANRAAKANVIRFTGRYAKSVSPKTHAHDVKVWEAV